MCLLSAGVCGKHVCADTGMHIDIDTDMSTYAHIYTYIDMGIHTYGQIQM